MEDKKRVNIRMSAPIFNYFEDMAKEMGVSRSFAMVMGLKSYIEQQKTIKSAEGLPELMEQLRQLNEQIKN